jgi:hypothetical protein
MFLKIWEEIVPLAKLPIKKIKKEKKLKMKGYKFPG